MCRTVCLALALCFSIWGRAAPFANLGFDLANTNNVSPIPGSTSSYLSGSGSVEELLPRWQLSYGSRSLSEVYLNLLARDPWAVSLISSDAQADHSFVFPGGFEGKFALGFTVDATPFTLTQTGQIPEDATLLTLRAPRQPGTRVEARLNGRLVLSEYRFGRGNGRHLSICWANGGTGNQDLAGSTQRVWAVCWIGHDHIWRSGTAHLGALDNGGFGGGLLELLERGKVEPAEPALTADSVVHPLPSDGRGRPQGG